MAEFPGREIVFFCSPHASEGDLVPVIGTGGRTLFYIPGAGEGNPRSSRDWMVMFLCRPFFKNLILHWHAAGWGRWLETSVQIRTRALTYRGAKQADLSIVLSRYNLADAQKLLPQDVRVVSNGIPDPCPDFAATIRPRRQARFAARTRLLAGETLAPAELERLGQPQIVRVLYLAHCLREKGLFDAIQGVVFANRRLAQGGSPVSLKLYAAGAFVEPEEKKEFDDLMLDPEIARAVEAGGFVSGEAKTRAFREADLFCFPTYYLGENQPVNIIEALAYGLPVVTTRWRSLPEMLPADYSGLVPIRSPLPVAEALLGLMAGESGERLRQIFLDRFTLDRHLTALAEAISSVNRRARPVPRRRVW